MVIVLDDILLTEKTKSTEQEINKDNLIYKGKGEKQNISFAKV